MSRSLSEEFAPNLDIDHVYINFCDFVWAYYRVGTSAAFMWFFGIGKLLIRQRLLQWGWISVSFEANRVVAKLLLEGIGMLLNFRAKTETYDGRIIGHFLWNDFPALDADGNFKVFGKLAIDVDITNMRMSSAKLDGSEITANDALTLVWFNSVSASHVKIHAVGNWGVAPAGTGGSYMKMASKITTIYNYFGMTVWPRLARRWFRWGWCRADWSQFTSVLEHGVRQGVPNHGAVRDLKDYSEVASFVMKTHEHFLDVFAEHKASMPGVDGEALFVGTVLHSLDHTLLEWHLEDPLWLDVDSPRFGLMAEVGRFVRAGFVEDLPGLLLRTRFRTAPSDLFRTVYRKAAAVNSKLADHMDTCIVK